MLAATDVEWNEDVVVKLERVYSNRDNLPLAEEAALYQRPLQTCHFDPSRLWDGHEHGYHALVQTGGSKPPFAFELLQ